MQRNTKQLTRRQRYEAKRTELLNLREELRKARTPYRQATLRAELQAVARELLRLEAYMD